ncbi:biotin transporter BioY [Janibacter anophelis]|uniref:biotin transporter BioY n=1 Tax=Janibacter anophelis TaxID=319054 RepID=UPI00082C13D0|nr:biotin transporter BioY [Janibacter anophelis]
MTTSTTTQRVSASVDLALVAAFAALTAVCSILPAINISTFVPITLQTFGVLLAGAVLGARRGSYAVLLWILVGAAGMPVFANGRSGLPVLTGPTGGYIVGFFFGALVIGLTAQILARRGDPRPVLLYVGGLIALVVIHLAGVVGLRLRAGLGWSEAVGLDATFWLGDLVKLVATVLVAAAVHRAFPTLLRRI